MNNSTKYSLSDEELRNLIELKQETPNLDYKESLHWEKSNNDARAEIVKDILAMSNTQDGGKLVIGVRDSDFEFVGLSDAEYESFDVTKVNQYFHKYADPIINLSLTKRLINGRKIAVIDVPEFKESPLFCKKEVHSSKDSSKLILRKGALYIRTDACESSQITTADQMRNLINRTLIKRKDELLGTIDKLISGKTLTSEKKIDEYKKYVSSALDFFKEQISDFESKGKILLFIKPEPYGEYFSNQVEAGETVREAVVRLRGWDFPHIDMHGNFTNFTDGKQSVTISERVNHEEVWRIYKNGMLSWSMIYLDDQHSGSNSGQKEISFIGLIYLITEMMLFAKRLYGEKLNANSISIQILMTDCKDRTLSSDSSFTLSPGRYKCLEPQISIKKIVTIVELNASFKEVARMLVKEIFIMFNWNDPLDLMLETWQKKLIDREG